MRRLAPDCGRVSNAPLRTALARLDPESVIAVLEPLVTERRRERLQTTLALRLDAVTLVLDAPHDPHNGAAILRSCDAFGISTVHVIERHESFLGSRRVAKGAQRWVDVVAYDTVAPAVAALEQSGHTLVATHPEGRLVPADLATLDRPALVLGNEHDGIQPELAAACQQSVRVPMRGFVESLNVSVSAAVLLAHATAGRGGDLSPERQRHWYARGLVLSVPRAELVLDAHGLVLYPDRPSAQPSRRA